MCARCNRAPHQTQKQSCCSMSERLSKIRGQNYTPKPQSISNNAMARKSSLLKHSLIFSAFFIIAIYAFFSTFLNPTTTPPSSFFSDDHRISASTFFQSSSNSAANPKPKVFMYDLPKKFTTGIIQQHARARGSSDVSKSTYPGHQHMGEYYLYSDLTRPEQDRIGSPVVKVSDPEEADLFYVPVFSSLSLIVKTNRPGSIGSTESVNQYSDEEMQEELVEWLEKEEYWRRNGGRDHVIFAGDPNALYRVMDRVKNAVLLVSDFGRVRRDQGSLVKDVIVPYSHRINVYNGDVGVHKRTTLLFFMGNRYRKDGGKIRDLLFQTLENEDDVVIKHGTQSRENRRAATQGMHTSKFCLNPAGDTPSACRLFDAIVSLCVPVIVSDSIELPFEDVIDYRKIAVFAETTIALRPGYLVKKLRKVSDERIVEYQKELRKVQRFFSYGNPNGTVNEIWREVTQKLPLIRLMINRDKRLVKKGFSEPDCSCLCTNQTGIISSIR